MRFFPRASKTAPIEIIPARVDWIPLTEEQRIALAESFALPEVEAPPVNTEDDALEDAASADGRIIPFESYQPNQQRFSRLCGSLTSSG